MNIRQSQKYHRPSGARYLVGFTLSLMCKSRYPITLRDIGRQELEDDSGSSLLSIIVCKTCKNVRKLLRVAL